jgi:hypothetical protein
VAEFTQVLLKINNAARHFKGEVNMKSLLNKFASLTLAALLAIGLVAPSYAALGYSTTLRNAQSDAITTAVGNAGTFKIYTASRPATCAAVTSQTLLATFTMGSPFAGASSSGVLTVTNPADVAAVATGTAAWGRYATSGGTCVMDMTITATGGGGDFTFNSTSFTSGVTVSYTGHTITRGNQ